MVRSQADVVLDDSGHPVRQFGVMHDVTELSHAEDELRETVQRYRTLFEKANDAIFVENELDEIIEVNERACTVLGYSRDELLAMKVSDLQAPEVRGSAGRVIQGEIERHGSATFEAIDVHRTGRRIAIEVTNAPISHRGQQLIGDRVQLQQVLLNLILNAIEAMSAVHGQRGELTIASRQDGASTVVVEVRDSGSGFEAERAERLFEPFYTTKAEGLGIGLAISRSIVEGHGGRLWAAPNTPHGAIFRFSLPVVQGKLRERGSPRTWRAKRFRE